MKLSISKKFAKRSIKCLALFAPLAYLFGSLFFGLNGDHAGKFLEDATSIVTPDYDYLIAPENFSYGSFEWNNKWGLHLGFSLGSLEALDFQSLNASLLFCEYGVEVDVFSSSSSSELYDFGLGYAGESPIASWGDMNYWSVHFEEGDIDIYDDPYLDLLHNSYYICFYTSSYDYPLAFVYCWSQPDDAYFSYCFSYQSSTWSLDTTNYFAQFDDVTFYFDDGSHLPVEIEWNDELRSYFVPSVKPVESTSSTDYIFGQFFQKNNFLVQWGENAISDNPKGFAPFGAFFKLLDDNIFHLSDSQIGLMAYGYLYYCLHVLIACLAFDIVAFIPLFVQRVQDKLGGKEDD